MLSKKMEEALNKQINAELYSGYLYYSMAAYYQSAGLPGFANWMYIQAQEEAAHAQIMFNHITDRGGRVILKGIEAPPTKWASPKAPIEDTCTHERKVTGLIYDLVKLGEQENDYASRAMLDWFVKEQIEEEKSANDILQQINIAGDTGQALLMLDNQLAARVYTPPSILAGQMGGAAAP